MNLKDKVAVVTGGNSGIGKAIAEHLVRAEARVAIFGRDEETLSATKAEFGDEVLACRGDVRNRLDLEALFATTEERLGKVDILMVNAGIGKGAPLVEFSEEDFDELIDINFKGAFFTVQAAVPHLAQNASIVLTTSGAGRMAVPGSSVYGATKAALRSLARSISLELQPLGIRANALCCGPTPTPGMTRFASAMTDVQKQHMQEHLQALTERIPMKRFGTVNEMAEAALFLASDSSRYICGTELAVDGGLTDI